MYKNYRRHSKLEKPPIDRHFASTSLLFRETFSGAGKSLSQAEVEGTKLYRTYLDRMGLLLLTACLECGLVFGCDSSLSLLAKEDLAATAP